MPVGRLTFGPNYTPTTVRGGSLDRQSVVTETVVLDLARAALDAQERMNQSAMSDEQRMEYLRTEFRDVLFVADARIVRVNKA